MDQRQKTVKISKLGKTKRKRVKNREKRIYFPGKMIAIETCYSSEEESHINLSVQKCKLCHPPDFIILNCLHFVDDASTSVECWLKRLPHTEAS